MSKIRLVTLFLIFFFFGQGNGWTLNAPASSIERSQELIEKDRQLRKEIEMNDKVFIKKIVLQGTILPTKETIDEISASYENHWLSKADIDSIMELIKKDCIKNGSPESSFKITYKIRGNTLKLKIVAQ